MSSSDQRSRHGFRTRSIHGGLAPDPATGAILTPIFQSTTYVQQEVGVDKGYTYSRAANPTVAALERNLGEIEEALPATCFGTGLGAVQTLFFTVLKGGDHLIVSDVVYGGTVRMLREVLADFGVEADFVDTADPAKVRAAIKPRTRLIFIESPANPTLKLTDIAAVAAVAREAGALLAVDNTLLTAALQHPLDLGAHVSLYSTTKYIEGHNSTVGGALVTRDAALDERFRYVRKTLGTIQAPFEAWLTLRGLKTLALRMKAHSETALAVAQFLEKHPLVAKVSYPGLPSFPQYELACRQQGSGGGMVAFELTGGAEAGKRLMKAIKVWSLAESLGATESLVTHPVTMTHGSVPEAQRLATGITDGLVRLSVGLEDAEDLIADLDQALVLAHAEAALPR
ncbi:MAG: aminotransferase class I/II-fold pyridoxal phosphate-dependent enzyme [Thermoanaerobaculia bacterium]